MNKLINAVEELEIIKRIKALEKIIDSNESLNNKIDLLKETQKKMVNAKEFNQYNQYLEYKKEYDDMYEEILDFPFVEEYLELLDEANNLLLDVSYIIEKKINSQIKDF